MKTQRYDRHEIKAVRTDNGHIYDTPTLTRVGVFPYRNPDGSIRRELRLPDEVFRADSLDSLRGVPITAGHVGGVANAGNAYANIGTVLTAGRQDGDNLVADIVIHNPAMVDAGSKELSCGYECDLDETAGVWNGEPYDAVQRNIVYNHLAVVSKGRAGNARLNLDAADFNEPKQGKENMKKIRLDNGIEYEVPPEVAAEYGKLRADKADAEAAQAKAEAERDVAQAKADQLEAAQETVKAEAKTAARERVKLEQIAADNGVQVKADTADRDLKIAVIQKIRNDNADLSGKSDAYVDAAFDLARADATKAQQNANAAKQRADAADNPNTPAAKAGGSAEDARAAMIAAQRKGVSNE